MEVADAESRELMYVCIERFCSRRPKHSNGKCLRFGFVDHCARL